MAFVHCGQQISCPAGSRSWRQAGAASLLSARSKAAGRRVGGHLSKQKQIPTDDWTPGNAIVISDLGRVRDVVSVR